MDNQQRRNMTFYYVTYHERPDCTHFVESTISGFCLFTEFISRAKLFTENEANELVDYLTKAHPKKNYNKYPHYEEKENDKTISFKVENKQTGDHKSDT